jgi:cobalt-precorrin 5A hydrolase/precorrin-3B C17-methyltransferase
VSAALGIGHDERATFAAMLALVEQCLRSVELTAAELTIVASIDTRAAHGLVAELARHFGLPARYFPASRLETETPRLANPSPALFERIGCHGVAEAAALAAIGPDARLILPKAKGPGVTCAIAQGKANRR